MSTPEHRLAQQGAQVTSFGSSKLGLISAASFTGRPIPDRQWLVKDLIPLSAVTMISGDGGLGKSLLAMQLATACATGKPWLGRTAMRCTTAAFHCEDEFDELQIRQHGINKHFGLDFADLRDLHFTSRVGQDNLLTAVDKFGKTQGQPTAFYNQIQAAARSLKAQLIILDSLHDLFAGNENSRPEARGFVNLLRRMALDLNAAVVLLAHPSVAGMSSGTGSSGSTAWNAAVRSRLYLTRPNGGEDPDARELKSMKANYAGLERPISLRWSDGVFVAEGGGGASFSPIARIEAESAILKGLSKLLANGAKVACNHNAKNGLVPQLHGAGMCKTLSRSEILRAQDSLLESGRLDRVEMGPPTNRVVYVRPAETRYPGEKDGDRR